MTTIQLAGLAVVAIVAFALLHRLAWFAWSLADRAARRASPHLRGWGAMAYAHPLRAALAARWPRLYAVLARRVNPHSFAGLPLTLMAIAALYVFGLFGGLIEDLLQREGIILFDADINALFAACRVTPLLEAFLWLTAFGSSPAIVAVGVVATGFLWSHSRSFLVAPLWITVLGAQATTWAGKYVIGRERPGFIEAASAVAPSFPSAHATAAMAVYGFIAYVIARELPTARARFELVFWTATMVTSIGFSRIFLGVHYTSDVVGGFLVGTFWLLVGVAGAERARRTRPGGQ